MPVIYIIAERMPVIYTCICVSKKRGRIYTTLIYTPEICHSRILETVNHVAGTNILFFTSGQVMHAPFSGSADQAMNAPFSGHRSVCFRVRIL